jgi:proteasome-associated ATPase
MPMPSMKPPAPDQRAIERQVDLMLGQIRTKPDTGLAKIMQTLPLQHKSVQLALLQKLVTHYANSNSDNIRRLQEENRRLKLPPHQLGLLEGSGRDEMGGRLAIVLTRDGLLEVAVSGDVQDEELVPGSRVALAKGGAIVGVRGLPPACAAAEFERMLPDGRVLLEQGNQPLVLIPGGEFCNGQKIEELRPGDLVEFENSTRHVLRIAEKSVKTREFIGQPTEITWKDVGGLDDIRKTIEKEVLGPILHEKEYGSYRITPPKGLLLEGPPGVGKTMLVKALASSLLSALDLGEDAPVIFKVKGTSLLSSYVGEGPRRVRALGAAARDAAKEFGLSIVMLDDFEYSALHRGIGDRSSPAYSNLSAALISEMDGLDSDTPIVWAVTANRADIIDSALMRPGRLSKKISIPRPNPQACLQILLVHLRGRPVAQGSTPEDLAEQVVQRLFSYDEYTLLMRIHYSDAGHDEIFPPRIISGAVLAEAVRGAALLAVDRDLSTTRQQPGGISVDDLLQSVFEQLSSTIAAVRPTNAHLHYLGLPDDQRVVAVEHVWAERNDKEELLVT